MKRTIVKIILLGIVWGIFLINPVSSATKDGRPNILWIFIEDASCHISCYGEKAIQTPNIDALAAEGIRFDNAFVSAPVCSPSRSALVTGMYQTTLGAHNHRSQVSKGKGSGNMAFYESYNLPNEISTASKLFENAGYYTSNENIRGAAGKQDYNFVEENIYAGISWKNSPEGVPFFSQIQLKGGKNRKRTAKIENIELPPYYFDDEIMREDWSRYLGSWQDTDEDLKLIVSELKAADVYDNTLIFFLTDHGISHLRGKQFLYDEGIKVPLIVKFPKGQNKGTVRRDMVMQIDLLPTSLAFVGIPIPDNIQGKDIFATGYESRTYTFAARDRCDETTEIIRSVRSDRYKYIRNFLSYRPHTQRNQYKDSKKISKHMRELYQQGKLNELQARFYQPTRPAEELYDLENDPFEINNLANDPIHQTELVKLRSTLHKWMDETNDPGLIPEPILEELGKKYGNKYSAMKMPDFSNINQRLINIIEAGEKQDISLLLEKVNSKDPSERYWAITWLGVIKASTVREQAKALTKDSEPSVRIAANLALYKIDPEYDPLPALSKEIHHPNLIVGMYALNAIEQSGIRSDAVKSMAEYAADNKYEFTKRFARYLLNDAKGN